MKKLRVIICVILSLRILCGIDASADAFEVSGELSSKAKVACVMDYESGRIIYSHNDNQRVPMASTTKIMTALVALERGQLDDVVTISSNAANTWGSDIKLRIGEKLTLKELLYGLMLNSGNDAAVVKQQER